MSTKKNIDSNLVSILSTPLRVRQDKALPILTAYSSFLECAKSEELSKEQIEENRKASYLTLIEKKSEDSYKASEPFNSSEATRFKDAAPGSVLIVPVMGVMMRESSFSWRHGFIAGTRELESIIKEAENSGNISCILFKLNSPGGQASGNESLARTIKACSIPTIVSFEGMASAAVESFIGVDEIYALEKDSYFGSIGTLTSIVDDSGFWEELGVKFIDIYAPQSTLKNFESREAKDGNIKPMEDRLEKSTDFFINDVKKARPQILDDGKIFKGALYNAVEAQKIKAIDGIKDLDSVIKRALILGKKSSKNNQNNSKQLDNLGNMTPEEKLAAEKAAELTETVEVSKEEKGLLDSLKSVFGLAKKEEKVEANPELEKASAEVSRLGALVNAHEKSIQELTTAKVAAETKVAELEADKAKLAEAKVLEGEEPFKSVEDMVAAYNKTFEHNQELGGEGKSPNLPVDNKETTDITANNKVSVQSWQEREAEIKRTLAEKEKAKKEAKKQD